jgi:PAS domain S-box-containing protein
MKSDAEYESDLQIQNKRLEKRVVELESRLKKRIQTESLLKETLQELHIHQEELRTQNEDLIRAQEEIETANRKYQDLYNFAPVGFFNFDRSGRILEVNLTGADLLGGYRSNLIGSPFRVFLDKKSKSAFTKHLRRVLDNNPTSDTVWLAVKDEPSFPAEIVSTPFSSESGQYIYCRSAIRDISKRYRADQILQSAHQELERINQDLKNEIRERQNAEDSLREREERLRASLDEKNVLLTEIHHRVKNNMQVISSLMALQADEVRDAALRSVLLDVNHRVRSMAMVHEKLYQSSDLARIDFADYAQALLKYLWQALGSGISGIRLDLNLEPVLLSVNAAVPCGLILNELFSNALKHAFTKRKNGTVIVSLQRDGSEGLHLCVRDNGIGFPPDYDWKNARSLGLRLVQMLAKQLNADVNVTSDKGTEITIIFEGSKAVAIPPSSS